MSVICGSLTWLEKHVELTKSKLQSEIETCMLNINSNCTDPTTEAKEKLPAWFNIESKKILETQKMQSLQKQLDSFESYEKRISSMKYNGQQMLRELKSEKNLQPNRIKKYQTNPLEMEEDSYLLHSDGSDPGEDDTREDDMNASNKKVLDMDID